MNANVNPANVSTEFEYDGVKLDFSTIPQASLISFARKGVAHYLGNEQASKVSAAKAKAAEETKDEAGNVVPGRALSDDEIAKLKADFREVALRAMNEGTMGLGGSRGPVKDPYETQLARLAAESVKATLKQHLIKPPKGDEAVTFADGTKRTMAEMIEKRLGGEAGDGLRRAARKAVEEEAKRQIALKAAAQVKVETGTLTADALGL